MQSCPLKVFKLVCNRAKILQGHTRPVTDVAISPDGRFLLSAGEDAVVLPAEDGGYVLIGLRQPSSSLFEGLAWGCSGVMGETRLRLRRAGFRWTEPALLWDVDEPGDLERLKISGLMKEWFCGHPCSAVALPSPC